MIQTTCERCNSVFEVDDDRMGKLAECTACGAAVLVSGPTAADRGAPVEAGAPAAVGAADSPSGSDQPGRVDPPWMNRSAEPVPPPVDPPYGDHGGEPPVYDDDVDDDDRNFLPEAEAEIRSANLFRLGLVMTIAFFAPVVGGGAFVIPELSVFSGPPLVVAVRLLPLLAGIALMVMAKQAEPPLRSAGIIAAGAALFGMFLINADARSAIASSFRVMPSSVTISMILGLVGMFGMFISVRARWYRPAYAPTHVIGIVAAVSYVLYLLVPGASGTSPIAEPFQILRVSAFAGLVALAHIGCLVAAAVLCIMNTPSTPGFQAVARARLALKLLVLSLLIPLVLGSFVVMFEPGPRGALPLFLSMAVKYGIMFGGLIMLIPIGITDLLVGKTPEN